MSVPNPNNDFNTADVQLLCEQVFQYVGQLCIGFLLVRIQIHSNETMTAS